MQVGFRRIDQAGKEGNPHARGYTAAHVHRPALIFGEQSGLVRFGIQVRHLGVKKVRDAILLHPLSCQGPRPEGPWGSTELLAERMTEMG